MNNLQRPLRWLFAFFVGVLVLSACKEPDSPKPEIKPCFTVENDTFMDPKKPIQFLNCSEKATSYHWYFGDGGESTESNPAHLFANAGSYDVTLSAQNGDDQRLLTKRVNVRYPVFKKVRVLRMPVLNRHGLPFDPDGSGLDLIVTLSKAEEHGIVFACPFATNATLPYEFVATSGLEINSLWWAFELDCWGSGARDTVDLVSRDYEDLIDSKLERFVSDSIEWEIEMEGAQ
jgi:hypothetical protein